ncbi:MAG: hypothetical protein N2512_10955 [Armatimonadetes bacterium]|nr:hypothetical protein [Armatimonadota bacterium]
MTDFWVTLWTILWFFGLGIFSVLSVLVTVGGGRDVVAMLAALRQRHLAAQAENGPAGPPA